MRILFLTLMLSFLSHGAFGAAEGGGAEAAKTIPFPKRAVQILGTFLSPDEATSDLELRGSRETMAQKGFVLNMETIDEGKTGQLAQLLSETRDVTKLKIKNLKWNILKSALESKPELRFDNLKELDLSENGINHEIIEDINNLLFSRIPSLNRLSLCGNQIGDEGAQAIANSPHMARLITLNLWTNLIGDAVKEEIKARFDEINPKCLVVI
jgi:hypothetical protein